MNKRIISIILCLVLSVFGTISAFASSFQDVKDPSWYSEAVDYVVEHQYMAGIGNGRFSPSTLVTRAQLTQILYAAEEKPEVKDHSGFTDVPASGKWYCDAVYWGVANSIVAGYPDKTFRPNQAVTREQLVSVLFKYAIYKEKAEKSDGNTAVLEKYSDAGKVADYAKPAMVWAVENGIISGTNIGLEPKSYATRAQMAVIIRGLMEKVILAEDESSSDDKDPSDKEDSSNTDKKDEDSANPEDGSDTDNNGNSSEDHNASESDSDNDSSSKDDSSSDTTPSGNTDNSPDDSSPLTDDDSSSTSSGTNNTNPTPASNNSSSDNNELPVIAV